MTNDWLNWLKLIYSKEGCIVYLNSIRDIILRNAELKPTDILLDVGTGIGLLAFGAYEKLKEKGKVIASDISQNCLDECSLIALEKNVNKNFEIKRFDITDIQLPDCCVDVIVSRSVLCNVINKQKVFKEFYRILNTGGRLSFYEPIFKENTKITALVDPKTIKNYKKFKKIEQQSLSEFANSQINFDVKTLKRDLKNAGFIDIKIKVINDKDNYVLTRELINNAYFHNPPPPGLITLEKRFSTYASKDEINTFLDEAALNLEGKKVIIKSKSAFITARKKLGFWQSIFKK